MLDPLTLLGLAAAGAYFLGRKKDPNMTTDKGDGSGMQPIPMGAGGATVFNREVARGVHPALQNLLDAWEQEGWFDVVVASGVRTQAQQAANYAAGLTKASDVSTTPHGRGAALDIHPAGFDQSKCFAGQPGMLDKMNAFGNWAKTKGMVWGGDFSGYYSPACKAIDNVQGDRPHVEIAGWRSLPFPPPNYFSPY